MMHQQITGDSSGRAPMSRRKGKASTKSTKQPARVPKVRRDRGTVHTRLYHARATLSPADQARLELLVYKSPKELADAGLLNLGTKKKPRTPEEAARDERDALFARAANAPHAAHRQDPVGRAWFAGLLEGYGVDPTVLRDVGREYGLLYWSELKKLDAGIGGYEEMIGQSLGRGFYMGGNKGFNAVRWNQMEEALKPVHREVRRCLQMLCVDDVWFNQGPAWLDRLINKTPRGNDDLTIQLACQGLVALAYGVGR